MNVDTWLSKYDEGTGIKKRGSEKEENTVVVVVVVVN
jgi:hypothetical protein